MNFYEISMDTQTRLVVKHTLQQFGLQSENKLFVADILAEIRQAELRMTLNNAIHLQISMEQFNEIMDNLTACSQKMLEERDPDAEIISDIQDELYSDMHAAPCLFVMSGKSKSTLANQFL